MPHAESAVIVPLNMLHVAACVHAPLTSCWPNAQLIGVGAGVGDGVGEGVGIGMGVGTGVGFGVGTGVGVTVNTNGGSDADDGAIHPAGVGAGVDADDATIVVGCGIDFVIIGVGVGDRVGSPEHDKAKQRTATKKAAICTDLYVIRQLL